MLITAVNFITIFSSYTKYLENKHFYIILITFEYLTQNIS